MREQLSALQLDFLLGYKYYILDENIKNIKQGDFLFAYFKDYFEEVEENY